MPIEEINLTTKKLVRTCSACGGTDEISLDDLKAGAGGHAVNTILAPDCPGCGAGEQWFRTWDQAPENVRTKPFGKRRAAVNALFGYLVSNNQSHADHKSAHAAETKSPPDLADLGNEADRKIELPGNTKERKAARIARG